MKCSINEINLTKRKLGAIDKYIGAPYRKCPNCGKTGLPVASGNDTPVFVHELQVIGIGSMEKPQLPTDRTKSCPLTPEQAKTFSEAP